MMLRKSFIGNTSFYNAFSQCPIFYVVPISFFPNRDALGNYLKKLQIQRVWSLSASKNSTLHFIHSLATDLCIYKRYKVLNMKSSSYFVHKLHFLCSIFANSMFDVDFVKNGQTNSQFDKHLLKAALSLKLFIKKLQMSTFFI